MALVTVQRSPSVSSSPQSSDSGAGAPADDDEEVRTCKSLSECYFAGKGAAIVLPPNERARPSRRISAAGCDIQQHLQSMFYLLRPEETLKMAVKLESVHPGRTRYLVVVSCTGRQDAEESCLLGIDCHTRATVGLVLRVLADTAITLDGDGGFSVSVCGRQHIFKPVSVQAMWSALQTLHKVSSKAREQNYFLGGLSHDWVSYYEQRIESDRSCLNEWHAMDNLESRRPPSPDSVRNKPRQREETERVIRATLKEIMMSVDLDEVTSKYIRGRLEEDLDMDLGEFKPFIDQEMLIILGQMDAPTEIFDHVYLGSEWNASNLEELQKNGVRHILNVTREIDNFFPGMFNYLNVRVYDDEKTDLLKHWDDTFKYITKAKKEGSKVLVHCKMGVSRSASVVIAYAMKAYNWDFSHAWKHVKDKRSCIKPNNSFLLQLETYQGILDAMKNKEKLQRSKSDTNHNSPTIVKVRTKESDGDHDSKDEEEKKEEVNRTEEKGEGEKEKEEEREEAEEKEKEEEEDEGMVENDKGDDTNANGLEISSTELRKMDERPKSWSPNVEMIETFLPTAPLSQSLENIEEMLNTEVTRDELLRDLNVKPIGVEQEARNVLLPCGNGQSYSVSQNKIVHLPGPDVPSVKHRISKLENQGQRRRGLVLNLTNQFEAVGSKPSSPESDDDNATTFARHSTSPESERVIENGVSNYESAYQDDEERTRNDESDCLVWNVSVDSKFINTTTSNVDRSGCITDVESSWTEPTANERTKITAATPTITSTSITTSSTSNVAAPRMMSRRTKRDGDPFSTQLDRVFDREEKRGDFPSRDSPSRQSSWSSYDSAVVLENNSVHSSWATLPSRNSSWGSYDMRPSDLLGSSGLFPYDKEEIPWHPGTVKRTKQKLEEGSSASTVKRVCTQNNDINDTSNVGLVNATTDDVCADYNPVLLHYTQSPTPRRRDYSPYADDKLPCPKSANINNVKSPTSIDCIDISPVSITRQLGRLSTSAPACSSLTNDADNLTSSLRTFCSESETSSPCVVNTSQCTSVKHHKMVLENLRNKTSFNKRCLSVDDSSAEANSSSSSSSSSSSCDGPRNLSGIVKNLKKEFEAKSTKFERSLEMNNVEQTDAGHWSRRDSKIIRSLPSSPVITHSEITLRSSTSAVHTRDGSGTNLNCKEQTRKIQGSIEDLSVKMLVGKYEVTKPEVQRNSEIQMRSHKERGKDKPSETLEAHPPARSKIATQEFTRRSVPITINHPGPPIFITETPEGPGRPPVPSPSVIVASVVAKAASKKQQQHGRNHPLARLQVRPRHSSPVYNTM